MLSSFDMEEHRRRMKPAGRVSFSRPPWTPYCMEERMETRALELCAEKSQMTTCYCPLEVPTNPDEAMEFLSRTWSPSSADFFQIFSSTNLLSSPSENLLSSPSEQRTEQDSEDSEEQRDQKIIKNFSGDNTIRVDQLLTLLSSGKLTELPLKHKISSHSSWMKLGQMKSWLRREILNNLSRGGRRRKKEEFRIHEAQVHAAISVARLASAVAGIVANCHLEPIDAKAMSTGFTGNWNDKMSTVVASAAALVATVCAESAESVGASKDHVESAIFTGLVTRSSSDMMALSATAATCLRGAAQLQLRAVEKKNVSEDQKILARGAQLPVRLPEGTVELRTVWIYHKHDKLILKLGKKLMRGMITTHKEYRILDVIESSDGCFSGACSGFSVINMSTSGGTMQILFGDQKQYMIWKAMISHLVSDC